jgi:hypothetical protein
MIRSPKRGLGIVPDFWKYFRSADTRWWATTRASRGWLVVNEAEAGQRSTGGILIQCWQDWT